MPKQPAIVKAVQPSAALGIDGEKYQLVYDYNAIAEAEIVTGNGCNLLHGLIAPGSISASQLRGLLFAALRIRHPKLTLAEVGHLIRLDTVTPVLKAIGEAWALSMPEAKINPPEAADDPGESSGS